MFYWLKFWLLYLLAYEDLLNREYKNTEYCDWDLIEQCWH